MRSAAVIGTGLIGTSVALALSQRGVSVYLSDADPSTARTAAAMGAGNLGLPETPVDLAVFAVPPARISAEVARWQRIGLARAYTDVGSVKARPGQELSACGGDPASYVGGHPLAGGERSGPLAARGDLFQGRYWVLTTSDHTDQSAFNHALELVSLCGAVPVLMNTVAHDRAVALTSHAPHMLAALMAGRLVEAEDSAVRISGQGLRDMTRIAGGDPGLWSEILDSNAAAVADVLASVADDLDRTVSALRALVEKDEASAESSRRDLEELLRRGTTGRARIPQKDGRPSFDLTAVPVEISDRPGALAHLLADAGACGVNIEDVRIEHVPDPPRGLVELMVERAAAGPLSASLRNSGWLLQK
ncbi:prephenate dehydrogenase [Streptomyces arenae]|uniref:prephenate dehydrogenase n=1 Tax=Streptomyces arenae TaxID=29301 RepID=UPI00265B06D9|nr:prephenate dehydrogenase [Streptomyces arenae]MCG7204963.1 prephenate dehydrogenase [Streptomyces arenae]